MNIALLLAGGTSERFGKNDKLQEPLLGMPVFLHSFLAFLKHPQGDFVQVVGSENIRKMLTGFSPDTFSVENPGKNRYESLKNGISAIQKYCRLKNISASKVKVLVHNGANPFVSESEISSVLSSIAPNSAVALVRDLFGTVRRRKGMTVEAVSREGLFEMETPQGAYLSDFEDWISQWDQYFPNEIPSDELELAIHANAQTIFLPAEKRNRKITTPEDIPFLSSLAVQKTFSTGIGIDSHALDPQKPCVLCGIEIPNAAGFLANSDGDIALHALSNALSSAFGGNSFSEIADPLCKKGILDSKRYLSAILERLAQKNGSIRSVSLAFEGPAPKVEKHFSKMRESLSDLLQIPQDHIGLTATTGEGTGIVDGMRITAIVTISV